ncbi:MAG: hypothetical protein ACYTF7_05995 [Planctomycetota bacterium]|jgi:hypothetical protein
MRITPSNSFHLQRAYNVTPPARIAPAQIADAPARSSTPDAIAFHTGIDSNRDSSIRKLVASVVPGGVDFSGDEPQPSTPALPMYSHPADTNAVATTLQSGRLIDTNA